MADARPRISGPFARSRRRTAQHSTAPSHSPSTYSYQQCWRVDAQGRIGGLPDPANAPATAMASAQHLVDAAKSAGKRAEFVDSAEDAGQWLARESRDGDVVLLKASRGVKLERALEKWKELSGVR